MARTGVNQIVLHDHASCCIVYTLSEHTMRGMIPGLSTGLRESGEIQHVTALIISFGRASILSR